MSRCCAESLITYDINNKEKKNKPLSKRICPDIVETKETSDVRIQRKMAWIRFKVSKKEGLWIKLTCGYNCGTFSAQTC